MELIQGNFIKLVRDDDGQAIWVNSLLLTEHDQNFIRTQDKHDKTLKARSLSYVVGASGKIDNMVERVLRSKETPPNPPSTDEQFVRRIYLDIIGRIPTATEAKDFLESENPAKRRLLIDDLLQSEGYVSHNFKSSNYYVRCVRGSK